MIWRFTLHPKPLNHVLSRACSGLCGTESISWLRGALECPNTGQTLDFTWTSHIPGIMAFDSQTMDLISKLFGTGRSR